MKNKFFYLLIFTTMTSCGYSPREDIQGVCDCYDKAFTKEHLEIKEMMDCKNKRFEVLKKIPRSSPLWRKAAVEMSRCGEGRFYNIKD